MRNRLFIVPLYLISYLAYSQSWDLVNEVKLQNSVTAWVVDLQDEIYIGSNTGTIIRYDEKGTQLALYSELANSSVTDINVSNRLKPFLFYRDLQQFVLLDRFSARPITYHITDYVKDFVWLANMGPDQSLWFLIANTNELVKINQVTKRELLRIPLQIDLRNAERLMIHQNIIMIDAKDGIYFFDEYGVERSKVKGAFEALRIIQEGRLIGLLESDIIEISISNPRIISKIKAPRAGAFKGIIRSKNHYIIITENGFEIYRKAL